MHARNEIGLHRDSLLGFIGSQRQELRYFVIWRLVSVLLITPYPVITQRLVDVSIPNRDTESVLFLTGLSLGLLVLHFVARRIAVASLSIRMQRIMRELRARLFHKLNFMHFGFLDSIQTGRLLSKYAIDTSNIEFTIIILITSILPELLRSALLVASLAYINMWLLFIMLISIPLFALIRWYYFRHLEVTNRNVRLAREKMAGLANEYISAIKLVRGFGQEQAAGQQMGVLSDAYSDQRVAQMKLNQSMGYIVFTAITAITICAIGFGGWLVIEERLSIGAMVALAGALPICLQPVNLFAQFSIQYVLGAEGYRSIKELMDSSYVEEWQGAERLQPMQGRIEFDNVSFAYQKNKPDVIRSFSADIRPNEHVAFIGPSGSGKSTLLGLMLGFYAPIRGEIRIDGIPQQDLDIRDYRQHCAIVMQDNLLLSGTLLDNIRFGRPSATMNEVQQAAEDANAWQFIEELPDGIETEVGERGVSLSGGQRQRIAIARALLRDPKILIFDEATSALDYESERLVQEAIDRLSTGRTTITIAHRLSTIRNVDRIIVLDHGQKVGEGSWEQLAAEQGAFKAMLDAHEPEAMIQ
jgi:ABC-type multidrug transport system fused ATPase/permease subunit